MNEIDKEISEKYSFEVKGCTPYKNFFILNTSKGRKILKKTILSKERIQFIHEVKEHLVSNGFTRLDRYICNNEGNPYFFAGKNFYTITDYLEGVECNFDSSEEVVKSTKLLAEFHKATRGFEATSGIITRDELGKLPQSFEKRLEEIKKLKKVALKEKNRFDYLFLEYYDYFYQLGDSVIKQISCQTYNDLVDITRKEGILCHHDFTHCNILNTGEELHLINFEYCCFEVKVYDIANFLRRKMRKCNWNINEAKIIIDEYRKIEDINNEEFYILKLILKFPQKFWRVINKYYNSKRCWSEKSYVGKLQEVIDETPFHKNFLDEFETLI